MGTRSAVLADMTETRDVVLRLTRGVCSGRFAPLAFGNLGLPTPEPPILRPRFAEPQAVSQNFPFPKLWRRVEAVQPQAQRE